MGPDGDLFENAIVAMKNDRGVARHRSDRRGSLQELVDEFKAIFAENVDGEAYPSLVVDGEVAFPQDPMVKLQLAIEASVLNNPRAVLYRQKEKIADDLGTAVNVQSMVFGNKGDICHGRGLHPQPRQRRARVLRRLPGERPGRGRRGRHPQHEPHRRSEDRRGFGKRPAPSLEEIFRRAGEPLPRYATSSSPSSRAKLWMLQQTRAGKAPPRPPCASPSRWRRKASWARRGHHARGPDQLDQLLHPQFDKNATYDVVACGLNASPAPRWARPSSAADAVGRCRGRPRLVRGRPTPTTWPA